jgi:hypothetical protein
MKNRNNKSKSLKNNPRFKDLLPVNALEGGYENAKEFSKPNGHGFFAESLAVERAIAQGSDATQLHSVGRGAKDSADIIIDGEMIQVKMHATASSTFQAVKDNEGGQRYINQDGSAMSIMVADEQVSYLQDRNINATGIGYSSEDIKNFTSSAAGIDFVGYSSWNDTMDPTALFGTAVSSFVYTFSKQEVKDRMESIKNSLFIQEGLQRILPMIGLEELKAAVSILLTLLKDLFNAIYNRIIFNAVINAIAIFAIHISSTFFGFSAGGPIYVAIVLLVSLWKVIVIWESNGLWAACAELFKTLLLTSLFVVFGALVFAIASLILNFKDVFFKHVISGLDTLVSYLKSFFGGHSYV